MPERAQQKTAAKQKLRLAFVEGRLVKPKPRPVIPLPVPFVLSIHEL
jgi:hypothetical protein